MMHKWLLWVCFFLPIFAWSEPSSPTNQLTAIEQELQILKDRLQQIQIKEMNEEVDSQEYMIADWEKYAKELESVRRQEEEEKTIKLKIRELEERKKSLMQSKTTPQ